MAIKAVIFDLWNTIAYNKGAKVNPMVKLEDMLGLNIKLYREVELGFMNKRFRTRKDAMISLCRHVGVKPTERMVNNLVDVWSGLEMNVTFFPDVIPVIDQAESLPGFYVATGFSGHGFGIGPGAGKAIAGLLTNTDSGIPLDEFRLSRFFDGTKLEIQGSV